MIQSLAASCAQAAPKPVVGRSHGAAALLWKLQRCSPLSTRLLLPAKPGRKLQCARRALLVLGVRVVPTLASGPAMAQTSTRRRRPCGPCPRARGGHRPMSSFVGACQTAASVSSPPLCITRRHEAYRANGWMASFLPTVCSRWRRRHRAPGAAPGSQPPRRRAGRIAAEPPAWSLHRLALCRGPISSRAHTPAAQPPWTLTTLCPTRRVGHARAHGHHKRL